MKELIIPLEGNWARAAEVYGYTSWSLAGGLGVESTNRMTTERMVNEKNDN